MTDADSTTPGPIAEPGGRAGDPADNQRFRDWNVRNILMNLVQAEEHARFVEEGMDPEHVACINKHLLSVRGELGELMGHTTDDGEREAAREALQDLEATLKAVQEGDDFPGLDDVKALRKEVEPHTVFDPSNCRTCGDMEAIREEVTRILKERGEEGGDMSADATAAQALTDGRDDAAIEVLDDMPDGPATATVGQASSVGPIGNFSGGLLEFVGLDDATNMSSGRVGTVMATPIAGKLGSGLIDVFTTPLGKRIAMGSLGLGFLGAASALELNRGTQDEFLILSGLGLGEAIVAPGPAEATEARQNARDLMQGNVGEALIDGEPEALADELAAAVDDIGGVADLAAETGGGGNPGPRTTSSSTTDSSSGGASTQSGTGRGGVNSSGVNAAGTH